MLSVGLSLVFDALINLVNILFRTAESAKKLIKMYDACPPQIACNCWTTIQCVMQAISTLLFLDHWNASDNYSSHVTRYMTYYFGLQHLMEYSKSTLAYIQKVDDVTWKHQWRWQAVGYLLITIVFVRFALHIINLIFKIRQKECWLSF